MFRKNKKIIKLFFLGIIILGFLSPLPFVIKNNTVQAQTTPIGPPPPPQTQGPQPASKEAAEAKIAAISADSCGLFNLTECLNMGLSFLFSLALVITGSFLGLAGTLLDFVISHTVVNMATNLRDLLKSGGGIYSAWTTLRDLANLLFIFIILYISIGTILRLDGVNTKKLLVHVIIVALFLNFSLFFTKVIIDSSNIVSTSFSNAITSSNNGTASLSTIFVAPMGMSGIYNQTGAMNVLHSTGSAQGIVLLGILGSILFIVTGFVFFAASIMLISRYVILIFLMVLSPLAFISMALPNDKYSSKWWHALFDQALFAPVFLALLWVSLIIIRTVLAPINNTAYAVLVGKMSSGQIPSVDELSLIMNFMIIIGSIVFSLVVAKNLGGAGASGIMKWGKKATGTALMAIPGRIANNTEKKWAKTSFGQTMLGSAIRAPLGALGGASLLGGKSGKKQSEEVAKRKTKWSENKAQEVKDDAKARGDKAGKRAAARLPEELARKGSEIGQERLIKITALEANYQDILTRTRIEEAEQIQRVKNNASRSPDSQEAQQEIRSIREKASEKIREAEGKMMEEKNKVDTETNQRKAEVIESLVNIKEAREKKKKEVSDSVTQQEIDKKKEQLKNKKTKVLWLFPISKAERDYRELIRTGKKTLKTDWEKLLAGVKEENKDEGKGDQGGDKGGEKKGDSNKGGGNKGGGGGH